MGGTSCRYSSFGTGYSNCNSGYQNGSVLTTGAIAGIVIGSLVGIVFIILILFFIYKYKLARRNNSSSNQRPHMNVYDVPMNTNNHQESTQTSEMFTPSKLPTYDDLYENA